MRDVFCHASRVITYKDCLLRRRRRRNLHLSRLRSDPTTMLSRCGPGEDSDPTTMLSRCGPGELQAKRVQIPECERLRDPHQKARDVWGLYASSLSRQRKPKSNQHTWLGSLLAVVHASVHIALNVLLTYASSSVQTRRN